jgi:hypothetical protein
MLSEIMVHGGSAAFRRTHNEEVGSSQAILHDHLHHLLNFASNWIPDLYELVCRSRRSLLLYYSPVQIQEMLSLLIPGIASPYQLLTLLPDGSPQVCIL